MLCFLALPKEVFLKLLNIAFLDEDKRSMFLTYFDDASLKLFLEYAQSEISQEEYLSLAVDIANSVNYSYETLVDDLESEDEDLDKMDNFYIFLDSGILTDDDLLSMISKLDKKSIILLLAYCNQKGNTKLFNSILSCDKISNELNLNKFMYEVDNGESIETLVPKYTFEEIYIISNLLEMKNVVNPVYKKLALKLLLQLEKTNNTTMNVYDIYLGAEFKLPKKSIIY